MIDILNRDEFVDNIIMLIESISNNKGNTSFAINGMWGSGKSFVLDMLEEKLSEIQSEETANDKYFIIRYNCWKYDYYEEPLIAIVSALILTIEEKTEGFFDEETKHQILGMLKATGFYFLSLINNAIREKTGIDFEEAYQTVISGQKAGAEQYENEHDYDYYLSFNKALEKLSSLLKTISESYTIVLLVDELDRCMPQYAVKVLERLHHLTEGEKNIITAISIDKTQLMASITQLFGFKNPEKYLEKFISFDVELNCGTISEKYREKYSEYLDLFDENLIHFEESIEEFIKEIFRGIDIRTQEKYFNKAMTAHKILFEDKKDYCFMCMELLLTVLICKYNDNTCFSEQIMQTGERRDTFFNNIFLSSGNRNTPHFSTFMSDKLSDMDFLTSINMINGAKEHKIYDNKNLYWAIFYVWSQLHKYNGKYKFTVNPKGVYSDIVNHHKELKRFAEIIKIIK